MINQTYGTKVFLQVNIPSEALVTGETNRFIEVHARVLPLSNIVLYEKICVEGLTMFSFDNTRANQLIDMIDKMCQAEAQRIDEGQIQDEFLYHEIAEYGI
jgi:hypothetical protein